jgi:hypothetical protein
LASVVLTCNASSKQVGLRIRDSLTPGPCKIEVRMPIVRAALITKTGWHIYVVVDLLQRSTSYAMFGALLVAFPTHVRSKHPRWEHRWVQTRRQT